MKLIKIIWKLSLVFIAGCGWSMEVEEACVLPQQGIRVICQKRAQLYEIMSNEAHTDDQITAFIEELKLNLASSANLLSEAHRKEWESKRQELLDYLDTITKDLPSHREVSKQIRRIETLLEEGQPCYEEVREFIKSAVKFPIYLKQASEFKERLVCKEIVDIEDIIDEEENPMTRIEDLISFIKEDDFLDYKGDNALTRLQSMKNDLDSYRKVTDRMIEEEFFKATEESLQQLKEVKQTNQKEDEQRQIDRQALFMLMMQNESDHESDQRGMTEADVEGLTTFYCARMLNRIELSITDMMTDPARTDHQIMRHIKDLQADLRAVGGACASKHISMFEPKRQKISDYLDVISKDLPRHRAAKMRIQEIETLLPQKPCYEEVREFIRLTTELPVYKEVANELKARLVRRQMIHIKSMMLGSETEEEIKQEIQGLIDFIMETDDLKFQGKVELLRLGKVSSNLYLHRAILRTHNRLCQLINRMQFRTKKEAEKMAERISRDLEEWKRSIEPFGEHYAEHLKKLEQDFEQSLLALK